MHIFGYLKHEKIFLPQLWFILRIFLSFLSRDSQIYLDSFLNEQWSESVLVMSLKWYLWEILLWSSISICFEKIPINQAQLVMKKILRISVELMSHDKDIRIDVRFMNDPWLSNNWYVINNPIKSFMLRDFLVFTVVYIIWYF